MVEEKSTDEDTRVRDDVERTVIILNSIVQVAYLANIDDDAREEMITMGTACACKTIMSIIEQEKNRGLES
jgi:hypothetical protein